MTTITNTNPNVTYKAILTTGVSGSGSTATASGITSSLQAIQDSLGTSSAIQHSTLGANINGTFTVLSNPVLSSSYTFSLGGNFSTSSTLAIVGAFSTTAAVSMTGAFTTAAAFTTSSTVSITGAFTTAAAFTTAGAFSTTLTSTAITNSTLPAGTHTLVGLDTTDTLTNKTLTSPIISTISNTGTLTLPTSTDTLVGKATTDTLTNKTLTSPKLNDTTALTTTSTTLNLLVNTTQTRVQHTFANSTAITQDTTHIPTGSTPTTSNGTQIYSGSITPKSASNELRVQAQVVILVAGGADVCSIALFKSGSSNAIATSCITLPDGYIGNLGLDFWIVAGGTSAQTFTVRMGATTQTTTLNGGIANPTVTSSFSITEYTP